MTERFLSKIDDQEISYSLGDVSLTFHFYSFRGLMYLDLMEQNNYIFAGKRVMSNQWILPNYIAEGVGNFRFETYAADAEDYVWYDGFNDKFRLVSYSDEEIKEMQDKGEE